MIKKYWYIIPIPNLRIITSATRVFSGIFKKAYYHYFGWIVTHSQREAETLTSEDIDLLG